VRQLVSDAGLVLPDLGRRDVGGRRGEHGEHLQPLLAAMQGMYRSDPEATW
jgi:1,2-phenylacetyl-CoA epoxidase catalytic subunit